MDLEASDLSARLESAGVFERLAARGFHDPEVRVDRSGHGLPRATVSGLKDGRRHLLLEAFLSETVVPETFFDRFGHRPGRALDLALVYWLREQDPTRAFAPERPALPLQQHPGLGCLRRAFRAIVSLAGERGKDGVASIPKLFHDAVLFQRSRLFLFLDPVEQGRFEALQRDLDRLPLGEASIALAAGCVRDGNGQTVQWTPGLLVFPLSDAARTWLHSDAYASAVEHAAGAAFRCDLPCLERARAAIASARAR